MRYPTPDENAAGGIKNSHINYNAGTAYHMQTHRHAYIRRGGDGQAKRQEELGAANFHICREEVGALLVYRDARCGILQGAVDAPRVCPNC